MKSFSAILVLCIVSYISLGQTTVSKSQAKTAKPKASPTPTKKSSANTSTPKPTQQPTKKTFAEKKNSDAKQSKKASENDSWLKAVRTEGRYERIAALRQFVEAFPKSPKKGEALTMIAFLYTDAGNEKLGVGDVEAAVVDYKKAVADAPKPIPDQLWTQALSRIPANLYFRGARDDAIAIVKILENKVESSAKQLLEIANFYLTIENGADAKQTSLKAIALEPNSSLAHQTLGLALRMVFECSRSASAYEQAINLDPNSIDAKRGLAEMKRALGRPDEAETLYREILSVDADNQPARTGLVLALFDADKTAEAEAELAKSLDANPGNVILLAGAAYWYASRNNGAKAIELAQRAIETDPRYIWSHIALARGLLLQKQAVEAERTLLAARLYGNFPTLEYELATARLAAGYYREAAEGLSSVFEITDGTVSTNLGGRVPRRAADFTTLLGDERRASIFAFRTADSAENAASLAALLEFKQQIDSAEKKDERIVAAVDRFVKGEDPMKVHRQIFAASQLLEAKVALSKALELTKNAMAGIENGLAVPNATVAVLASELYENRAIAITRGEYVVVPEVPKATLSAILRGRIEEIAGWVHYNLGSANEAITRLRRAVNVLPVDSTWWRSSTWRLGAAYELAGKDAEALDMYIKSYKSAGPDMIRYGLIEALYRKLNGNTDGLSDKIGPNPAPTIAPVVASPNTEQVSVPSPDASFVKPSDPSSAVEIPQPTRSPQPVQTVDETKLTAPTPSPAVTAEPVPSPIPYQPTEAKAAVKTHETFPVPSPEASKAAINRPKLEQIPSSDQPKPAQTQVVTDEARLAGVGSESTSPAEIKPCKIMTSHETINLKGNGDKGALLTWLEDEDDIDSIQAVTSSPQDVSVRRELLEAVRKQALFVLHSISDRRGVYQVTFELPCGKRSVTVNVR